MNGLQRVIKVTVLIILPTNLIISQIITSDLIESTLFIINSRRINTVLFKPYKNINLFRTPQENL